MTAPQPNSFRTGPDERGHFGIYGGRFVAETLMPLILDLEKAYMAAKADPKFQQEMDGHLTNYVGRPSPLYFAERLTQHCGGAKIYFTVPVWRMRRLLAHSRRTTSGFRASLRIDRRDGPGSRHDPNRVLPHRTTRAGLRRTQREPPCRCPPLACGNLSCKQDRVARSKCCRAK